MLRNLDSKSEVGKRVDRLLLLADAYGRFPTPVEDIVAAAELTMTGENPLDESALKLMPKYLLAHLRAGLRKVEGALDRRARLVHVRPDVANQSRKRFILLHETTHAILPHQQDLVFADDHETLAPTVKQVFEQEANQGAAELLFQHRSFRDHAAQFEISMTSVQTLSHQYGASLHSTLRRFAETHRRAVAVAVFDPTPNPTTGMHWRRREVVYSKNWEKRFGRPIWPTHMTGARHPFVAALDQPGVDRAFMMDVALNEISVRVEAVVTPYRAFVLLWVPAGALVMRPRRTVVLQ